MIEKSKETSYHTILNTVATVLNSLPYLKQIGKKRAKVIICKYSEIEYSLKPFILSYIYS